MELTVKRVERYRDICLSCSLTRLWCILDLKTMNVTYNAAFIVIVASIDMSRFRDILDYYSSRSATTLFPYFRVFSHAQLMTGLNLCYAERLAGNGKREGKSIGYLPR